MTYGGSTPTRPDRSGDSCLLEIRKDHFYRVENTVDGKQFVTARGWEDLSELLRVYRMLGKKWTGK